MLQMNILKEKNASLNAEAKTRQEINRRAREEENTLGRYGKQVHAIELDNNTQNARII